MQLAWSGTNSLTLKPFFIEGEFAMMKINNFWQNNSIAVELRMELKRWHFVYIYRWLIILWHGFKKTPLYLSLPSQGNRLDGMIYYVEWFVLPGYSTLSAGIPFTIGICVQKGVKNTHSSTRIKSSVNAMNFSSVKLSNMTAVFYTKVDKHWNFKVYNMPISSYWAW